MKVLVSGGAGYIGSVLVPQLLRNHQVTVLDSLLYGNGGLLNFYGDPHLQFVKGNICNEALVKDALKGVSVVIHLAALRMSDCSERIKQAKTVNVEGTRCLLEAAVRTGARCFIFASSCSVYGTIPVTELATEETLPNLTSSYAESKIAAENLVLEMSSGNDIRAAVLRFASAYGLSANMRLDLLLNGLALDAVTEGCLDVWGADTWRALAHVRDLVTAIIQSLESEDWCGIVNVGGHNRSKGDLARGLMSRIPGLTIEYHDAPPNARDYRVDFSKARALGFFPSFTPECGLSEVVESLQLGIIQTSTKDK